jgi:hypothetical protein
MNLNSFKRNRKALTALLICTGFIAAHPLAAFAEENVPAVQMVQQQKQSVSGVVKDSTGEPVIGANIREKGNPSNGTITDIDGNFSIKVNPDATLEISFIGYKTVEVKAVAGKPLNVILKDDSEMLEEVVVVGYGTMRKKDLTGSVVQIRPDKLANEAPKTVQDVLRGTPGLNIGYNADAKGGGTMMVRGQRSVYVTDKNNPANDTHNISCLKVGESPLASNDIPYLAQASDGGIWITHYHLGIQHYDSQKNVFTNYNINTVKGLPGRYWTAKDDAQGNLYVGHVLNGLSIIDLKKMTARNYRHDPHNPNSIPGDEVYSICIDHNKNIWVGLC